MQRSMTPLITRADTLNIIEQSNESGENNDKCFTLLIKVAWYLTLLKDISYVNKFPS